MPTSFLMMTTRNQLGHAGPSCTPNLDSQGQLCISGAQPHSGMTLTPREATSPTDTSSVKFGSRQESGNIDDSSTTAIYEVNKHKSGCNQKKSSSRTKLWIMRCSRTVSLLHDNGNDGSEIESDSSRSQKHRRKFSGHRSAILKRKVSTLSHKICSKIDLASRRPSAERIPETDDERSARETVKERQIQERRRQELLRWVDFGDADHEYWFEEEATNMNYWIVFHG